MKDVMKEFHGDGTKVKCVFPCTKPGCSGNVDKTFAKPADGDADVTATCCVCDTNYEITIQADKGDVSGTITVRDVYNALKKEEITITVI